MTKEINYILLLLLLLLLFCYSFANMNVWTIGEGVRVNPITGRVYEEKYLPKNYKYKNWIWNSKKKIITLHGAKNEVLSFQIIIERNKNKILKNVNCVVSNLFNKNKEKANLEVKLFREWYVEIKDDIFPAGWYADPLISFEEKKYGVLFNIPCQDFRSSKNEILNQNNQAIWVDVFILPENKEGIYQGKIIITAENEVSCELNLKLKIFNFTIPKEQHIFVDLMDNYEASISKKGLEIEKKYYQMANEHRTTLNLLYIEPGLRGNKENLSIDWSTHGLHTTEMMKKYATTENYQQFLETSYDLHIGPYLDGTAFVSGPCKGVPLTHMFLPFEDMSKKGWHCWPLDGKDAGTPRFETTYKKILNEYEKHFKEKGWTKTELMIWYNGFEGLVERWEFDKVKYYGQLIKNSSVKMIKHRADFANEFKTCKLDLNNDGKIEGTDEIFNYLNGVVQICCPDAFEEGIDIIKMQKRSKKEDMYFFNGIRYYCGDRGTNGEALSFRVNFWICWKYNLKGFVEWCSTYRPITHRGQFLREDKQPVNVFYETTITLPFGGGGYSMFFYPGQEIGISEPIPCIRLKMMRRGAQDYEYLWLLKQRNKEKIANKFVNKMVKRGLDLAIIGRDDNWEHNPYKWDKIRLKMANILDKKK